MQPTGMSAPRLTLDHNCLIHLETPSSDHHAAMCELVELHQSGRVALQMSAIGGSELLPTKQYSVTFTDFLNRLTRVRLEGIKILRPRAYLDMTFLDWCLWSSDDGRDQALDEQIHAALFGKRNFTWTDYARARGVDPDAELATNGPVLQKWRNVKCDVLAMWSHIFHGGDSFVTTDSHFHKSSAKRQLVRLGAGTIIYPGEAVSTSKTLV